MIRKPAVAGYFYHGSSAALMDQVERFLLPGAKKVKALGIIAPHAGPERFGADTITDLSMGGDIPMIRDELFRSTSVPFTTVPIYEAAARFGIEKMDGDDNLATIRSQAASGVSSMVLHCVNTRMLGLMKRKKRITGIVSKGGLITSVYMHLNGCENPFIERFDEILDIFHRYDIVPSLGNTARSGGIHDGRDEAQIEEIKINSELGRYAREPGVQVIVEGAGGHVRYDRIAPLIRYYKKISPFPLFVAGPLPTDIALGYHHIAGCVGASAASAAGADYLCYITPAEHLGLQTEVEAAIIALQRARAGYDAARQTRVLQEQTLQAEQEKYSVGATTSFFLIQYQRDLAQARSDEVLAESLYAKAQTTLERAVGIVLTRHNITFDEAYNGQLRR